MYAAKVTVPLYYCCNSSDVQTLVLKQRIVTLTYYHPCFFVRWVTKFSKVWGLTQSFSSHVTRLILSFVCNFTDGCESHITGVGTALLSIYFRFLILNMTDGNSTMAETRT